MISKRLKKNNPTALNISYIKEKEDVQLIFQEIF